MATIKHSELSDPDLHEVKGVSSATANQVLVATGTGGSRWVSFDEVFPKAEGRMKIYNNTVQTVVPTAVDPTLHTSSDYVEFTDLYVDEEAYNLTIDPVTKVITIEQTGVYNIAAWVSLQSTGTNDTNAFTIVRNGVPVAENFAVIKAKLKDASSITQIAGFGNVDLSVGDTLGIAVANDLGASLTIHESDFLVYLIRLT